jgi:outer membrane protein OmpA-like peptidoglycan-associated protein
MTLGRGGRAAALLPVLAAALAAACAPKKVRAPVTPASDALVVLLPDADSGTTGHAGVSATAGSADLDRARDSTIVKQGEPPSPVTVMDEQEVERIFGETLAALPPAPIHFMLFYKFDSDELTDESRALVPSVLETVKNRPLPEVVIIGHTDTIGTAASNFGLGMRRALAVRTLLLEAGLDAAYVQATSHGEADLLVPTADNVAEPRNRRVEVTVR